MIVRITTSILILLLAACTAKSIHYTPIAVSSKSQAIKIIEQVFFEQHIKYRPQNIFITDDFIGLARGTLSKSSGLGVGIGNNRNLAIGLGSSKTLSKGINQRIYFNSLGAPELYIKRGRYIAQIKSKSGQTIINVRAKSEVKAKRFMDSIMYFVKNAKQLGK